MGPGTCLAMFGDGGIVAFESFGMWLIFVLCVLWKEAQLLKIRCVRDQVELHLFGFFQFQYHLILLFTHIK